MSVDNTQEAREGQELRRKVDALREPVPVIDLRRPSGTKEHAQVAVFAEDAEAFERIRKQAADQGLRTRLGRVIYSQDTGQPFVACHWDEEGVQVSLHGPRGYVPVWDGADEGLVM